MRLAYLTSRFPYAPLGETFLAPEVRRLASLCDELHVIPARPGRVNAFGDLGAVDVRMGPADAATIIAAAREFAGRPSDAGGALHAMVFGRYPWTAKLKNLSLFAKSLAVARYVRARRIDHIHANWLTTSSTIAYVAHRLTGIPWSCTAHAHDIYSANMIDRKLQTASFVRIISARNCRSLNEITHHRYADRTLVGHLGVEMPDRAAQIGRRPILTMICPARLHRMKGHIDLLHALASLQERGIVFRCDLAGDGELREDLRTAITRLGLEESVRMRGVVAHANLLHELRAGTYDLVVLASIEDEQSKQFFEGIPVALIEAMAAGIPCIATNVGSISELIDGRTGVLVEQHDPHALAEAIGQLARDPARRELLGAAARERISADFNAASTTQQLYDSILAACAPSGTLRRAGVRGATKPASMPAPNAN